MPNHIEETAGSDCPEVICYTFEVHSVQWEYEDKLPEMSDVDYARLFERSEVRDGVRMFPYLEIYSNETGEATRLYFGT